MTKHIIVIKESHAAVGLTQIQHDVIVRVASGGSAGPGLGSTLGNLTKKIKAATGWRGMRPVQLFCRFAHKHGLVEL